MDKKWDTLSVLAHSRHDWLNHLQLIKGYLSLQDVTKVNEIIDDVIGKARMDSKLSDLSLTSFAEKLLTYSWEKNAIILDFEVVGKAANLSRYDEVITNWTTHFLNILERTIHMYNENYVTISIEIEKEEVCFFFDFRGKLEEMEVEQWLDNNQEMSNLFISEIDVNTQELSIKIMNKEEVR